MVAKVLDVALVLFIFLNIAHSNLKFAESSTLRYTLVLKDVLHQYMVKPQVFYSLSQSYVNVSLRSC